MASFQERVIGALRLSPATYEEVEKDTNATSQAAIVVVAAAISAALAGFGYATVTMTVFTIVLSLVAWVVGAFVLLIVGTKMIPGRNTQADLGQMLRTVGFARAPGLFGVLAVIPVLGFLISLVLMVWGLVALVIAVRQALDYDDTLKAVIVCVITWVIMMIVMALATLLGLGAAGVGGAMF
jgi:hypothetical protein